MKNIHSDNINSTEEHLSTTRHHWRAYMLCLNTKTNNARIPLILNGNHAFTFFRKKVVIDTLNHWNPLSTSITHINSIEWTLQVNPRYT